MRAILIDPVARTVTEVEHPTWDLGAMYAALSFAGFAVGDINAVSIDKREILWVDGEGHLKAGNPLFRAACTAWPLAGRGLILGVDRAGANVSTALPLSEVARNITWTDLEATGRLRPDRVEGHVFIVGEPIARPRLLEPAS